MHFEANHTDFRNFTGVYEELFLHNDKPVYANEDNDRQLIFWEPSPPGVKPCWYLGQGDTQFANKELIEGNLRRVLRSCGDMSGAQATCTDKAISPDLAQKYCGPWLPMNLTQYRQEWEREYVWREEWNSSGNSSNRSRNGTWEQSNIIYHSLGSVGMQWA